MKVSLGNGLPDIEVNVKSLEDGSFDISIKKIDEVKGKIPIADVKCGSTVKIGKHHYIVLSHGDSNTTFLVSKNNITFLRYGEKNDYSYPNNPVRRYLNEEFYKELCKSVGESNIIPHIVDLTAEDGTGNGHFVIDKVSLLDTSSYRKYRNFLQPSCLTWWTVTPSSYIESEDKVCYVDGNGVIRYNSYLAGYGIRPCFVLSADAKVDDVLGEVK